MQNLRSLFALIMVMAGAAAYAQITSVSSLGGTISRESGAQWIGNYKKQFKTFSEHTCSKSQVQEMFCSADAAGVYLIKGLDDQGNERLIAKPARENGAMLGDSKAVLMENNPAGNSAGMILDDIMARPMVEKFRQTQKADEFGAHVYGKKVFEDLLSQPGATGVYIAKGLDEHNQEHLVLAALDKTGKVMWTGTIWNHGSGIFSIIYPIAVALAAK
jgi:hypothetical protein